MGMADSWMAFMFMWYIIVKYYFNLIGDKNLKKHMSYKAGRLYRLRYRLIN